MKGSRGVALLIAGGLAAVTGCGESSTGPTPEADDGTLSFNWTGGGPFAASGAPDFQGGDLSGSTFALAVADSLGGVVVTGFRPEEGSVGDLFILQIGELHTGTFGPCSLFGDGRCHGRVLEDLDATAPEVSAGSHWEITTGSVQLDVAGPDRVAGSFAGLVLRPLGAAEGQAERTIQDGTFDLPLLKDAEAAALMRCFLRRAAGDTGC